MFDREVILPLVVGAVIAVLVNLLLLPTVSLLDSGWSWQGIHRQRRDRPVLESPSDIRYGTDDGRVSSVAWIPYEAYEELVAPPSRLLQPAVQQEVDPVPQAPVVPDPTPPMPPTQEQVTPQPPPPTATPRVELPPEGDVAVSLPAPPAPPAPPNPDAQPVEQPTPPAADAGGRPTAAPKVDRDADPVMITERPFPVRPGQVVAAEGIEIKTARPQFSLTTALTAIPLNPIVSITFEPDGSVYDAKIIRSSGYADVDGPVLACLYRWRAGGEALQRLGQRFTGEWKIMLIDE